MAQQITKLSGLPTSYYEKFKVKTIQVQSIEKLKCAETAIAGLMMVVRFILELRVRFWLYELAVEPGNATSNARLAQW